MKWVLFFLLGGTVSFGAAMGKVNLRNGEVFAGKFTLDLREGIVLHHRLAKEPLRIKPEELRDIQFRRAPVPVLEPEDAVRVSLVDGSVLPGKLVGLNQKELTLEMMAGKHFKIPRKNLFAVNWIFRKRENNRQAFFGDKWERALFSNGDGISGKVEGIKNGQFQFEAAFAKFNLPIRQISYLFLNPQKEGRRVEPPAPPFIDSLGVVKGFDFKLKQVFVKAHPGGKIFAGESLGVVRGTRLVGKVKIKKIRPADPRAWNADWVMGNLQEGDELARMDLHLYGMKDPAPFIPAGQAGIRLRPSGWMLLAKLKLSGKFVSGTHPVLGNVQLPVHAVAGVYFVMPE